MGSKSPTWNDVTRAKHKASTRTLVQVVWALTNTTDMSNEDIRDMLRYVQEQQESFALGYMNYKDILKALREERDLDLRELEAYL